MTNPVTLLKEVVDPMIEAISEEEPLTSDEFLGLFGFDVLKKEKIPDGDVVELYGAYSDPAVYVGDRWRYQPSERAISTGKMKLKKMTIAIELTEDQYDLFVKKGDSAIITKMIKRQLKDQVLYLRENIIKFCMAQLATTDAEADNLMYGFFGVSSSGTISNPSDMASIAGTREDLDAILWSGSQKTQNNVSTFMAALARIKVKLDYLTHIKIPWRQTFMVVHPIFKSILDNNFDLLNSTTGELDKLSYTKRLAENGITVIETAYIDSDYAGADGGSTDFAVFADPDSNFTIWLVEPIQGTGWMEWAKIDDGESIKYIKRKKVQFGTETQAFALHTDATTHSYFKTVIPMKTTPYDNTA